MLTSDDIRDHLRIACSEAGGVRQWADQNGLAEGYMFEVLRGDREPAASIANRLGFRRVVGFEPLE